ncbi:hypothetical protein BD413DRAFT_155908 [Trametes elegans]|nr:hypothetical protein BD413DRAFT_155908 [Trametes elegans]
MKISLRIGKMKISLPIGRKAPRDSMRDRNGVPGENPCPAIVWDTVPQPAVPTRHNAVEAHRADREAAAESGRMTTADADIVSSPLNSRSQDRETLQESSAALSTQSADHAPGQLDGDWSVARPVPRYSYGPPLYPILEEPEDFEADGTR